MSLPYELMRDIFHRATFIPHEWDVNATSIIPGLFRNWDELHIRAWREVLPLRRTIAHVSRQWRASAIEFLYSAFHDVGKDGGLESFASILSDYPYYGTLVKRLTIRLTGEPQYNAQVARVLQQCPNVLIIDVQNLFGNDDPGPVTLSGHTTLSMTIRQLDIEHVSTSILFATLPHLPNLEILRLSEIHGSISRLDRTSLPLTVLPNLRILQLSSRYVDLADLYTRSLKLPRLSALSTNIRSLTQPIPILPNDIAKCLLCLEFRFLSVNIRGWKADDLPNLRCLRLRRPHLESDFFRSQLPMEQIVELTCDLPLLRGTYLFRFQPDLDAMMAFTLDPILMPNLKSFTLDIAHWTRDLLCGKGETGSEFRTYFAGLITAFKQREVDLYCYQADRLHGKILIEDVMDS